LNAERLRVRILFVILIGVICYGIAQVLGYNTWILTLAGGWVATIILVLEHGFTRISVERLIVGVMGLGIGALFADLLLYPILSISFLKSSASYILVLGNVIFASVGLTVALRKEKEIINFLFHPGKRSLEREGGGYKILDTSVIIDGRIADLCEIGFLEGTLLIPQFVLVELQQIADSSSPNKRTRGKRGLDIVNKLQSRNNISLKIIDDDFPDIKEVDGKLLQLAKKMGAKIVTNDHNLKKVAKIQDVKVLNINELATALKPIILPGENLKIVIVKEGENPEQGVGYLEDGTMVVVEGGKRYIGKETEVVVTSVIQTTTGKMIFTEVKNQAGKRIARKRESSKGR